MLELLTKYLFQFRTVSVPHVGTIQIVQHPAQVDVVEKKIYPPTFIAELKIKEEVSEHQLEFLDSFLNSGKEVVLRELKFFGDKLQEKINGPGFEWKGLGTITRSTQSMPLNTKALETVIAEKITRADAQHPILVGDQQMTSIEMAARRERPIIIEKKTSVFIIAGWILLGLSILAIAVLLYIGKFRVNAAGLKVNPTSYLNQQAKAL